MKGLLHVHLFDINEEYNGHNLQKVKTLFLSKVGSVLS
jgi:hypothetical protein